MKTQSCPPQMHSTIQSQSPKRVVDTMRASEFIPPQRIAIAKPSIFTWFADNISPAMIAMILLLAAAETLVLINPQLIPAWCALGAVIATVFVFVHEKHTTINIRPGFLFLNALCTLFAGIALPRPVLTHWMGFTDLETWYPESFVLVAAVSGLCGFTAMHTIYLTLTGELPSVIKSMTSGLIRRFFSPSPPPPPAPGPPHP